jgi:hypothetical protein
VPDLSQAVFHRDINNPENMDALSQYGAIFILQGTLTCEVFQTDNAMTRISISWPLA